MSISVHPTEGLPRRSIRANFRFKRETDLDNAVPPLPPDRALRWVVIAAVVLPLIGISFFIGNLMPDRYKFSKLISRSSTEEDRWNSRLPAAAAPSQPSPSSDLTAQALRRAVEYRNADASLISNGQTKLVVPLPKPRPKFPSKAPTEFAQSRN